MRLQGDKKGRVGFAWIAPAPFSVPVVIQVPTKG
jgi:hypothetical protein